MSHKINLTIQQLLDSRAHFGHMSQKWHPKMKRFILMKKENLHIVDLRKTLTCLQVACNYLFDMSSLGKRVMFVGTKEQAKGSIFSCATKVGMPYVSQRWIGGTLTNFAVLRKLIRKWQSSEKMIASPAYKNLTKKEQLSLTREKDKLSLLLGGLGDVSRLPSALIVVDIKKEHVAIEEAKALGIPVIGIVDTNCDPDLVSLPIPANDDTVQSIELILSTLTQAIEEGLKVRSENRQKELLEKAENVKPADVVVSSSDKAEPKVIKKKEANSKYSQHSQPKVTSMTNFESKIKEVKKVKKVSSTDGMQKAEITTKKSSSAGTPQNANKKIDVNPKVSAIKSGAEKLKSKTEEKAK